MTHGENEIIEVAKRLRLDEREAVRGLREYVTTKKRSQSLQNLITSLKSIPISSSECERGFSQMNLILTSDRASLHTVTVSSLLFIRMVGPPLRKFSPAKYVGSWLRQGRNSAIETRSRQRSYGFEYDECLEKLWNLL